MHSLFKKQQNKTTNFIMSKKGSLEERWLVKYLEGNGYAATRIPASGGATKSDRPDVLAGNNGKCYAFEVKSSKKDNIYIRWEQINELLRFSKKFGAKPLVCVKFTREPYTLLNIQSLQRTPKGNYKISRSDIKKGTQLIKRK